MKIYSTAPDGNEAADMEPAHYFNLAFQQLEKSRVDMLSSSSSVQTMLVHLDILICISKKYPRLANILIEKKTIQGWRETFNDWFNRSYKKIPIAFREGIYQSASELFDAIDEFGYKSY